MSQADVDFVAQIVNSGGIKAASDSVGLHPATVYRRLKALQIRLNLRLFTRHGGVYRPSQLALEIAAASEDNQARLAILNRRVTGAKEGLAGSLRVTTTDSLCEIVGSAISVFSSLHAQTEVSLLLSNEFANLEKGEADVAIRPQRQPDNSLIGRRAAHFSYRVYSGKEVPSRWVGFGPSLSDIPAGKWLKRNVDQSLIAATVDSMLAAKLLCAAGVGKAVLPSYLDAGLFPVSDVITELDSDVWVLTHSDLVSNPRVSAFTRDVSKFLKNAIAKPRL